MDKISFKFSTTQTLPGIGRKTALKFVLYLLKKSPEEVNSFVQSIEELKKNIQECRKCHNIADSDLCEICADPQRDTRTILPIKLTTFSVMNTGTVLLGPNGANFRSMLYSSGVMSDKPEMAQRSHWHRGFPADGNILPPHDCPDRIKRSGDRVCPISPRLGMVLSCWSP